MATGQFQASLRSTDDIKKWQIQTCDGDEAIVSTANVPMVSTLYDGLMSFLKVILAHARDQKPEPMYYASLEESIASLFFWGRDFGVSQGELDMALQFSHRLRDTVLTLLISLGDLLILGLVQVVPTPEERQALLKTSQAASLTETARLLLDEPMQAATYEGENIERLVTSLQNIIQSLIVLAPSLDSIADDESEEEDTRASMHLKDRAAHEYFVDLIRSRFPSASQHLVQALGQSNWDRYKYVQKLRDNATDGPTSIGNKEARSEFQDSGIGSSAPAQSVVLNDRLNYAATVVSSRAETSHKRLPPLPELARSGMPFDCEVCSRRIQITRTKQWKEHVFKDICAYTCVFPDCASARALFKDRETMTNHLDSYHNISDESIPQICPLCFETICGGRNIVCVHFIRHMEEIALGVLPQGAESEDGSANSDDDDDETEQQFINPLKTDVSGDSSPKELPADWEKHWDDKSGRNYYRQISTGTLRWDFPPSEDEEPSTIKCICGYSDDDGNTVLCESCDTWQHITCYYKSAVNVPDVHECNDCDPRPLDSVQAAKTQADRRELIKIYEPSEPREIESAALKNMRSITLKLLDETKKFDICKYLKEEDGNKWRCKVSDCTKLFKGPEYLSKHIVTRHAEWLRNSEEASRLLYASQSNEQDRMTIGRGTTYPAVSFVKPLPEKQEAGNATDERNNTATAFHGSLNDEKPGSTDSDDGKPQVDLFGTIQDRYICPTCNKAFSRPSSLRIHCHSHVGEKPYKCPNAGCGKAFSFRSNLKRHERGCQYNPSKLPAEETQLDLAAETSLNKNQRNHGISETRREVFVDEQDKPLYQNATLGSFAAQAGPSDTPSVPAGHELSRPRYTPQQSNEEQVPVKGPAIRSTSIRPEEQAHQAEPQDGNKPRYCYCNDVSFGAMIKCDNDSCPRKWFHPSCIDLDNPFLDRKKWFCSTDCKNDDEDNEDDEDDALYKEMMAGLYDDDSSDLSEEE